MAGKLTAPFSSLSLQQFWFSRLRSIVKSAKISFFSAMEPLQQKLLHMEFQTEGQNTKHGNTM